MNLPHLVLFTVKIGSQLSLFSETSLAVSKIEPVVIGSSRKRCDMIPFFSPSILYHHILPLSRLQKKSKSALQTLWHPGHGEKNFICSLLLTCTTQVSNPFGFGRGPQIYKSWTSNGGNNWG